jgi:uncharacterized protein
MKFLVLVLVILVVVLLAKGARSRLGRRSDDAPAARPAATTSPGHEVMLACAHCGLHLPGGDALPGRGGVYCSEDHRAIAEARHGPG